MTLTTKGDHMDLDNNQHEAGASPVECASCGRQMESDERPDTWRDGVCSQCAQEFELYRAMNPGMPIPTKKHTFTII